MEYDFVNNGVCLDCSALRVSHAYSLHFHYLNARKSHCTSNVGINNNTRMSLPAAPGVKIEAWKENKSSKENTVDKPEHFPSEISYFSLLPHEILLYIFSFFNVYELCNIIAPVCTTWWKLSKDSTLWKHLRFSFERPVQGEHIKNLLASAPLLVTLELQSREDGGDLLHQVAKHCHYLKKLTVKFSDGLTEETFKSLVKNCPQITYLNVEGSSVGTSDCYQIMANFHNLRHLNLSHCHFLDNVGLVKIAEHCKHLEYIDIDGITGIHDHAVVCLLTKVGHCLTHLFLDGENLTDVAYQALSSCSRLKMLGISFCEQMTDVGLSGIYELRQLTFLKLRKGVQLTPVGLQKLFSDDRLHLLTHVNLGECSLMDDKVLIAMASSCPKLTHLVLHWCWEVTDLGISAIVNQCCHLRVLDLIGLVQLTGESFRNVSTKLPNLLILDLEQCNTMDDTILRQVVTEANNPLLRIFDYWGDLVQALDTPEDNDSALVDKPRSSHSES